MTRRIVSSSSPRSSDQVPDTPPPALSALPREPSKGAADENVPISSSLKPSTSNSSFRQRMQSFRYEGQHRDLLAVDSESSKVYAVDTEEEEVGEEKVVSRTFKAAPIILSSPSQPPPPLEDGPPPPLGEGRPPPLGEGRPPLEDGTQHARPPGKRNWVEPDSPESDAFPPPTRKRVPTEAPQNLFEDEEWMVKDSPVPSKQDASVKEKHAPLALEPAPRRRKIVILSEDEQEEDAVPLQSSPNSSSSVLSSAFSEDTLAYHRTVAEFFNTASEQQLMDTTLCSRDQASVLVALRPFRNYQHLDETLAETKGLSNKLITNYEDIMERYRSLDTLLGKCQSIAQDLTSTMKQWSSKPPSAERSSSSSSSLLSSSPEEPEDMEDSVELVELGTGRGSGEDKILDQPSILNQDWRLKDYQLLGISWLYLLYRKGLSGILADDMGLGKTAQVISFLAVLLEKGITGPHLIVVPSSTTENWMRELERCCPALDVELYYGSQAERSEMRDHLILRPYQYHVLVTTYNMFGSKQDRGFLRKIKFMSMVLDEGHMVKNMESQRYQHLTSIKAPFRLLLTGTPLQNNLHELISLLTFIMPDVFRDEDESLKRLFSIKNQDDVFLSKDRIRRARQLMAPFVLRRKKSQVLKDLPPKTEQILFCEQTPTQRERYRKLIADSRRVYEDGTTNKTASKQLSNILMQLRKMACHPLLHRGHYQDEQLLKMSKDILRDEQYWESDPNLVFEDMTYMSDFELHQLCTNVAPLRSYTLPDELLLDCGKIQSLLDNLQREQQAGSRVLIFSQFTMMLDILEVVLGRVQGYKFLRIDGSTPVVERQQRIDEFYADESIFVFLLSTKAGGFGINLTAANVVILYDLDFNPHNDAQAEDRAHRVGQTQPVKVLKLITKGTIEENIFQCAQQKLKLDKSMSTAKEEGAKTQNGDGGNGKAGKKEVEGGDMPDPGTIMEILRNEFQSA